MIQVAVYH